MSKGFISNIKSLIANVNTCLDALKKILIAVSGLGSNKRYSQNIDNLATTLDEHFNTLETFERAKSFRIGEIVKYKKYSKLSRDLKDKIRDLKAECELYDKLKQEMSGNLEGLQREFEDIMAKRRLGKKAKKQALRALNLIESKIDPLYVKSKEIQPQLNSVYRIFSSEKDDLDTPYCERNCNCCLLI